MKRLLSAILAVLMIFALALPAAAQESDGAAPPLQAQKGDKSSYIVLMGLAPVITYEGSVEGFAPTKPGKGGKINPNSAHVKKYEQFLQDKHNTALQAVGAGPEAKVNEYTFALNGFSALLTPEQAAEMKRQPGVLLVQADQMRTRQTDSSPSFLGLTGPGGMWARGFTGEGVVVGVIDDGIWPEHPSFADNGSFAPLPDYAGLPCEFGNSAHNPADAPFTCNNKLLSARQMLETYRLLIGADPDEFDSARDDNGHGTHTASTAAGNADVQAVMYGMPKGVISGVAPRARVIAYKALGNLGGFTSDLAAAIDQAVADGVHVINYSIGGGASAPGADELAFLFAADAGVHVATSAGNSGPGVSTLGNPATMPWLTTVGASTQSRFFQATVVLGNGASYTGASLTPGTNGMVGLVDGAAAGSDLCVPGALNPSAVTGKIVLCRRGVVGRTAKSLAVAQAGGAGMIMYENSDRGNLFSDSHWLPSVHVDNTPGLAIKSYIAGTANATAQIVGGQLGQWAWAPSMTDFSSRGPNPVAPDIIKPDITAPGIQILAGWSPYPDPGTLPGELFAAIAGTSMSSPHIAGILALVKQAHPDWSPAMVKSALMTTAYQDVRDNDRVSPADPFDMGAGHVDPGGKVGKGSIIEPGLVYDAGLLEYLGFLCGAFPSVFADPEATCSLLGSIGVPLLPRNLNLPSIGVAEVPGSETVYRTVTSVARENGWREYTASVQAPPGYNVTVQPSTLRLKSGEKATFAVTITNVNAPTGQWRFGSLTWKDRTGNYDVYSPIAIKGALFNAPAAVNGSGASGSASLNVKFGYSGPYSAAPHGLVGATVTQDTVVQDPDQNFDPNDGYSKAFQFNLAGTAQFRVAIPPEGTEPDADLDVFVVGPNGSLVGSSTSGGTEEQVDLVLPADGTYTVFVHGWSAPGGDSPFTMWSWAVPLASGGSLSISGAPGSATIGTVSTINANWSGLATGQVGAWYLGAVSHTGPNGLLGLTLVEVDNR